MRPGGVTEVGVAALGRQGEAMNRRLHMMGTEPAMVTWSGRRTGAEGIVADAMTERGIAMLVRPEQPLNA